MIPSRRVMLATVVAAVALGGRSIAIFSRGAVSTAPPTALGRTIQDLDRGYKLERLQEMPEEVTALAVAAGGPANLTGKAFVGTGPVGGVYTFNVMYPKTYIPIAEGMGDYIRYGFCHINSLAVRDMDNDGSPELFATTSQANPRGRPRLYIWSLGYPHVLLSMTRPDIRSSWSHGIGFLQSPALRSLSLYVTFCGYGEIVEYQPVNRRDESGFAEESIAWKKVGQLPASGEWLQSCDVDNDGQTELCAATGYVPGKAAILVYASDRPGADLRLERVIDEAGRFCNVRFIVGDTRGDGGHDLIAWWCLGREGGDSVIVRYRLAPEGVRERTVLAHGTSGIYWPKDGQIALMDLDGDGRREVWFANSAGGLWCIDGARGSAPVRIAQIKGEFGPIAASPATPLTPAALLIGLGRSILSLTRDVVPAAAPRRPVHPLD